MHVHIVHTQNYYSEKSVSKAIYSELFVVGIKSAVIFKCKYNNQGTAFSLIVQHSRFLAQDEQTKLSVVEATIKTWRGPEMDLVWSQQDKKKMSTC